MFNSDDLKEENGDCNLLDDFEMSSFETSDLHENEENTEIQEEVVLPEKDIQKNREKKVLKIIEEYRDDRHNDQLKEDFKRSASSGSIYNVYKEDEQGFLVLECNSFLENFVNYFKFTCLLLALISLFYVPFSLPGYFKIINFSIFLILSLISWYYSYRINEYYFLDLRNEVLFKNLETGDKLKTDQICSFSDFYAVTTRIYYYMAGETIWSIEGFYRTVLVLRNGKSIDLFDMMSQREDVEHNSHELAELLGIEYFPVRSSRFNRIVKNKSTVECKIVPCKTRLYSWILSYPPAVPFITLIVLMFIFMQTGFENTAEVFAGLAMIFFFYDLFRNFYKF